MAEGPLFADPGKPTPGGDDESQADAVDSPAFDEAAGIQAPGIEILEWTPDGGAAMFKAIGAGANAIARLNGPVPEGAFIPHDEEAEQFGAAWARFANRHARLRGLAEHSDVAIMAFIAAELTIREAGRVAAHRELLEEELADVVSEQPTRGDVSPGVRPTEPGAAFRRPAE